ncbi:MAG: lasso peptide biosynthesis B2 protein [Bacteroidetes bacterium]|nr:lasso peptide biosynthesis B2 protein [Bacteroidota bacterium]
MIFFKKISTHIFQSDFEFKKLLIKAFFYSMTVRFMMLFVKYNRYEKRLGKRGETDTYTLSEKEFAIAHNIAKALNGVSNYTLWESKCMVQAVSAKWMLQKYSIPSTIYFGIAKDEDNKSKLKAHAWLKVGDCVVTGRAGHEQYKVVNFYS